MKEYLEDRKIDKKYMLFYKFFNGVTFSLGIIVIFFIASAIEDKEYILAIIFFIAFVLIVIIPAIIIEERVKTKYHKLFQQRNPYYIFYLKHEYSYDELIALLNNVKKKVDKWYIKHENELIFRLKYGFFHYYIYRISAIKYNNFIEDEYKKEVIKLNKEYTDKLGTDRDNYRSVGKYGGNWAFRLHRINFIHSNELNKDLEKFISKNAHYHMMSAITSQTIIIIGNKMYVPSIRTAPGEGIIKHTRTLNNIIKWFNIEA